jgi:L-lactate utilization protein LutB
MKNKDDEEGSKDFRRKKFIQKKDKNRNEETLSHAMKKMYKKRKMELEEDEEWEDWREKYS